MLLSFLSLEAEEQTSYFKYPLVSGHDLKKLKSCATNPVSGLIMTFEQRVSLFEDVCDAYNEKLIEAVGDIKNFMIRKWNEDEFQVVIQRCFYMGSIATLNAVTHAAMHAASPTVHAVTISGKAGRAVPPP